MAEPLRGPWWHGWYGLPGAIANYTCDGEDFVLRANAPYYPLLQELTYIRPLRILSPNAFVDGIDTSPIYNNSCPTGWGTATCTDGGYVASDDCVSITCAGILYPSGTGPFKFVARTTNSDGNDDEDVQELFIGQQDAGGGRYYVIETKRWAVDKLDDLIKIIEDYKKRIGQK